MGGQAVDTHLELWHNDAQSTQLTRSAPLAQLCVIAAAGLQLVVVIFSVADIFLADVAGTAALVVFCGLLAQQF